MTHPLVPSFKFSGRFLLTTAVLCSAPNLWAGDDEAAPVPGEVIQAIVQFAGGEQAKEEAGYWIGLACEPIENELREKLKLEQGVGLEIEQVIPDSPAAKAGLQNDDVIVAAGKQSIRSVTQLSEAIAKTKDGVLKLHVIRQGERKVIEIRPAKREAQGLRLELGNDDEKSAEVIKRLRRQLEALQKEEQGQRDQAEAAKAQALKQLEAAKAQELEARRQAERAQAEARRQAEAAKAEAARAELLRAEALKRAEAARAEALKQGKAEPLKIESKEPGGIIFRLEGVKEGKEEGRRVEQFKIEGGKGVIILSDPSKPGAAPGAPVPAPPGAAAPRIRAVVPGTPMQAWGGFVANPNALPDDMKVSITKQGKQPATIVVEQGAKMWKTNENEMEMLPAAARAYASRILGGPAATGGIGGMGFGGGAASGGAGGAFGTAPVPAPGQPARLGEAVRNVERFELKLDPKGQLIPTQNKLPPGASVKKLEGGGIQIELRETEEKKGAEKNPAPQPRWIEMKRVEPSPAAKKNAEAETRELTEKLQQLRKQLEDLRKAAEEKRR